MGSSSGQAAWHDADDDAVQVDLRHGADRAKKLRKSAQETVVSGEEYQERLRSHLATVHRGVRWATETLRDDSSADAGPTVLVAADAANAGRPSLKSLLSSTGSLVKRSAVSSKLSPHHIYMQRLRDANKDHPSDVVCQHIDFHPRSTFSSGVPIFATCGFDSLLRIFALDEDKNPLLSSAATPKMPMNTALFDLAHGSEVVCGGWRPFFYTFDLESSKLRKCLGIVGKEMSSFAHFVMSPAVGCPYIAFLDEPNGAISLVDRTTKHWVADAKMSGAVSAACFSSDGGRLLSFGSDGEVYIWDMRSLGRCMHKFRDEGCIKGTAVAMSPDGGYIATGSNTGVVNIYRTEDAMNGADPVPARALMNLTSSISGLRFNHDGQILSMHSNVVKDALRLVHLPSMTVFQNFPSSQKYPLKYVSSCAFSPNSRYITVGNDKGKIQLYRIMHYAAFSSSSSQGGPSLR